MDACTIWISVCQNRLLLRLEFDLDNVCVHLFIIHLVTLLSVHPAIHTFSLPTHLSIAHPHILPSIHLSIQSTIHPSLNTSIHSTIHPTIHLSIYQHIHPLNYPSIYPPTHPLSFIYPFIHHLSTRWNIRLFIHLCFSVCLPICMVIEKGLHSLLVTYWCITSPKISGVKQVFYLLITLQIDPTGLDRDG